MGGKYVLTKQRTSAAGLCTFPMHEFVVGLNQENLANAAAVEDRMGTEVWTEQRGFSFFHLFY